MAQPHYSPERFLAIGAGAHALVEQIPSTSYPINDWDALMAAARSVDISLRAPGGGRVGAGEAVQAINTIRPWVGDVYFPFADVDDFAHKAGMILVGLVLRQHSPRQEKEGVQASADFENEKRILEEARHAEGGKR